jgi:hypothetical protein
VAALERLRGAVAGLDAACRCAAYDAVAPVLAPLLATQRLYLHHSLVTALLLEFAGALVETQLATLDAQRAQVRARTAEVALAVTNPPPPSILLFARALCTCQVCT